MTPADDGDAPRLVLQDLRVGRHRVVVMQGPTSRCRLVVDGQVVRGIDGHVGRVWASPEGEAIAAAVTGDEGVQLVVVDTARTEIVDVITDTALPEFAWGRDGEHLYIAEGEPGSSRHRRAVRRRLSHSDVFVLPLSNVRALSGSADGRSLMAVSVVGDQDVVMLLGEPASAVKAVAAGPVGSVVAVQWTSGDRPALVFTGREDHGELLVARDRDAEEWDVVHRSNQDVLRSVVWLSSGEGEEVALVQSTRHGVPVFRWLMVRERDVVVGDAFGGAVVFAVHLLTVEVHAVRMIASSPTAAPRAVLITNDVRSRRGFPWSPPDRETRLELVPASDGVDIPCFVTEPIGSSTIVPTVVSVYGGFGLSLQPAHSSAVEEWLDSGGRWVQAMVRGGGEEGVGWHRAGRGRAKRRSVLDVIDVTAAFLASSEGAPLGLYGESIGGLLVLAAANRRPDLVSAVVAVAPVTLVETFHEQWPGITWTAELGDPRNPEDAAALAEIDPLREVAPALPSLLVTVGGQDRTVPIDHARAVVDDWQGRVRCDASVELVVFPSAGHQWTMQDDAERRSRTELGFLSKKLLHWQEDANEAESM
jgi:prolyl oligopeptidase